MAAAKNEDRRRLTRIPGEVWCDIHGQIHGDEHDPFDEDTDCSAEQRPVYAFFRPSEGFDE